MLLFLLSVVTLLETHADEQKPRRDGDDNDEINVNAWFRRLAAETRGNTALRPIPTLFLLLH